MVMYCEFPFVYNACDGIWEPLEDEKLAILAEFMRISEMNGSKML